MNGVMQCEKSTNVQTHAKRVGRETQTDRQTDRHRERRERDNKNKNIDNNRHRYFGDKEDVVSLAYGKGLNEVCTSV